VAVKVARQQSELPLSAVREIKWLQQLSHPAIVRLLHCVVDPALQRAAIVCPLGEMPLIVQRAFAIVDLTALGLPTPTLIYCLCCLLPFSATAYAPDPTIARLPACLQRTAT
jgi:hypothetical protein